jgi:hypothetical protein
VLLAATATSPAATITYTIDVTVTAAPNAPGAFVAWTFATLPATFSGTFEADDTVAGPISNLQLIIGGVDVATTHPNVAQNLFNPAGIVLIWGAQDPSSGESAVSLGRPFGSVPVDYAVAFDNSFFVPFDPYFTSTQNWVGTFTIIGPPAAVPEPGALLTAAPALLGLFLLRRRRSRA